MDSQRSPSAKISTTALPLTIGDYIFTTYVARGGSSEIYLVNSTKFSDQVYVGKVITVDENVNGALEPQWKSFTAEVTALIHLNNPNIIRMYDHFRLSNQFILILEYCPNGSLSDKIPVNIGVNLSTFREVASQIVSALAFCHTKCIAHRDIKTSNVLFDKYGRVKLSDFGLSLHAPYKMLQHSFCGSLLYTAPEMIKRRPNNPFFTDIWSLGVLFIVMLQGRSPWTAKDHEGMIQQIIKAEYTLSPMVPAEVSDLISKMVVTDPNQRISIADIQKNDFLFPKPGSVIASLYGESALNGNGSKTRILNTRSLYAKRAKPLQIDIKQTNKSHTSLASSSFLHHGGGLSLTYSVRSKANLSVFLKGTFTESEENTK